MAETTKPKDNKPPAKPKPKAPAAPKVDKNKVAYQKEGRCPKCGSEQFHNEPNRPLKCVYCGWLVPKDWKSKLELEVEAYTADQKVKAKAVAKQEKDAFANMRKKKE